MGWSVREDSDQDAGDWPGREASLNSWSQSRLQAVKVPARISARAHQCDEEMYIVQAQQTEAQHLFGVTRCRMYARETRWQVVGSQGRPNGRPPPPFHLPPQSTTIASPYE